MVIEDGKCINKMLFAIDNEIRFKAKKFVLYFILNIFFVVKRNAQKKLCLITRRVD